MGDKLQRLNHDSHRSGARKRGLNVEIGTFNLRRGLGPVYNLISESFGARVKILCAIRRVRSSDA